MKDYESGDAVRSPIDLSQIAKGSSDPVNHPDHYTHAAVESIEVIESLGYGKGFCYGNAIKYLYRAEHKGDEVEDLKKARWYINRRLEQLSRE